MVIKPSFHPVSSNRRSALHGYPADSSVYKTSVRDVARDRRGSRPWTTSRRS